MEAVRTDEALPEAASGASPTTTKVSSMEPAGISIAAVAEAVEVVSPLGNILTICKQPFLDIIISCFNKVLFAAVLPLGISTLRESASLPEEFRKRQVLQLLRML